MSHKRAFSTVLLPGLGLATLLGLGLATAARADWIFESSFYSHDPATGQRTTQYAPPAPSYARFDENYLQSGFRCSESTVGSGNNADHLHIVETWGAGDRIRPYGEWLYPYRAGATPYGPWGNPQGPWTLPFDSRGNPYGPRQGNSSGGNWGWTNPGFGQAGMPGMPMPLGPAGAAAPGAGFGPGGAGFGLPGAAPGAAGAAPGAPGAIPGAPSAMPGAPSAISGTPGVTPATPSPSQ